MDYKIIYSEHEFDYNGNSTSNEVGVFDVEEPLDFHGVSWSKTLELISLDEDGELEDFAVLKEIRGTYDEGKLIIEEIFNNSCVEELRGFVEKPLLVLKNLSGLTTQMFCDKVDISLDSFNSYNSGRLKLNDYVVENAIKILVAIHQNIQKGLIMKRINKKELITKIETFMNCKDVKIEAHYTQCITSDQKGMEQKGYIQECKVCPLELNNNEGSIVVECSSDEIKFKYKIDGGLYGQSIQYLIYC